MSITSRCPAEEHSLLSASAPLDSTGSAGVLGAGVLSAGVLSAGEPAAGLPGRTALSFEVMPPRSPEQEAHVPELLKLLESFDPDYVAITSARGTGWAKGTARFIELIASTTRLKPLAHLTCTAGPVPELVQWIDRFIQAGTRGFLAVRGDLPAGVDTPPRNHLAHADALVALLRHIERRDVARLCAGRLAIGVAAYPAGHPESANADQDIDVLAAKARNGADFAITQLFFDPAAYRRLRRRTALAGVDLPIIPGIMPLTGTARLARMCQLAGLQPPEHIRRALETAGSEAAQYQVGLDLTAALAAELLAAGAPGLHLYTFNDARTVTDLIARLDHLGVALTTNHAQGKDHS